MPTRREKLELMIQSSPEDQLLRYMLAMEFDKEGQPEKSLEHFQILMSVSHPYVPAFLMAGQLLTRIGRIDEAKRTYSDGIAEANSQGNSHASGEMSGFLSML